MTKLDLKEKLKKDYDIEETKVKETARGIIASFLGIDTEDVSARVAVPHDKGIRIYVQAGGFQFIYNHPNGKIEFSLDGELYDVEKRADIGRIITFKENKDKY